MGFVQRRILTLVLGVVERPRLTLTIAAVALVACVVLALTRLSISTDTNKLFSSDVGFFHDYLVFSRKFPENEAIYVLVETKDPHARPAVERWTAAADAITDRLRQNTEHVRAVDARVPLDKLGVQGLLFERRELLEQAFRDIRQFAPLAKLWGENSPVMLFMGRTPAQRFLSALNLQKPTPDILSFQTALTESWNTTLTTTDELKLGVHVPDLSRLGATDPSRLGYYYVADESEQGKKQNRYLLLVRVYHKTDFDSLTAISETVESIRTTVAEAAREFPEFEIGVTGRPALDADEMRTTDTDTHRAEIVAMTVVFIGIAITLRSLWLALVSEIALAVGIGWTFGWATLTIGELNLLSIVFVIALIGIGMDYLVQVMTRYRRESRRYPRPEAVWARVFRYVSPPIFTACLGAAGAFFVSLLTDFRGAAELGVIAGGGLLLCLLAGYTVLPAILVLFPGKIKPEPPEARYHAPRDRRHALLRLGPPILWLALILVGIPYARRAEFNPNLLELQADNIKSVQLIRKVTTWFSVVMSKDTDVLQQARDAVINLPTIARTESILDAHDNYQRIQILKKDLARINWTVPTAIQDGDLGPLADKATQLANHIDKNFSPTTTEHKELKRKSIESLRRFSALLTQAAKGDRDRLARRLAQWQTLFVAQLKDMLAQFDPPPLDISKLPHELRQHYVADDGTFALYIYPKEDLWQREPLAKFVRSTESAVRQLQSSNPKAQTSATYSGIAPNVFHSTSSIERAFYKSTFYALALIVILVFLDLRSLTRTFMAISVLGFGLPMLVAIMGWQNIDWNFANFFALPILIGAGHEYGVFMMHRYLEVQHNPRRVWGSWDVSDRALLLCAYITSSSFGFFWLLGHHKGVKSLGLVMALGTCCIYLATVMVLRPLLKWRLERQRKEDNDE